MKTSTLKILLLSILFSSYLFAATGDSFNHAESVSVNTIVNGTLLYRWGNRRNGGNEYYYKFTAPTNGEVHIYSTGFSSDADAKLYDNNNKLAQDTSNNDNIDITYSVSANSNYYINLYNWNKNLQDNFTLHVDFTAIHKATNDICYGDVNGGCSFFTVACDTSIPISNISQDDLTDAKVYIDTSGFGSFLSDCSVDNGPSGVNCENKSNFQFGPATIFGKSTEYDLGNTLTLNDTNHSIQQSALFDMTAITDIYATYRKNGELYKGKLHQCGATVESTGGRDFELRHQENIRGDVKVIGNTVLCVKNDNGQCIASSATSNDEHNLQPAPESSTTLDIPSTATVKYARLYWQGRKPDYSDWTENAKNSAKTIKFRKNTSSAWKVVTADILDTQYSLLSVGTYSATADVTPYINANGAGTYEVDTNNFYTMTGATWYDTNGQDGLGSYGAWVLVVVYEDSTAPKTQNISIFDGYKIIYEENDGTKHNVNVSVSGFLTPKTDLVKSTLYDFVAEGDKYITGDKLKMAGVLHNTTLTDISLVANNAFNSSINVPETRNPNLANNEGIDIQKYKVGTGDGGKGIITNNETGAKFRFTTDGDVYFPSLLVFATEIYAPKLCYDYTYGQDGVFQTAPSIQPPLLDGTFDKSKPIDVKLYFKNLENSDISIKNLTVDVNPIDISLAKYRPNSVYVTPPNQNMQHIDNDTGLDVGSTKNYVDDIPIGDVGALDYFYTYYSLDANQSTINAMPINVILNYNLHVDINGVDTDIGNMTTKIQDMDPCQRGSSYQPVPGRFNIVHNGQTRTDDPYYYFNLPTQVVGRVGNFKVESMDPNDLNKSKIGVIDQNVTVEMIDVTGFHYATASCTDQNATVVSTNSVLVVFDDNNTYEAALSKTAMRNAGFFNKAVKNAAFRLGYYENGNTSGERVKTCSRDNFAIRPETYTFRFVDYNHSNTSQMNPLADNNGSTIKNVNLAAGYNYKVKIEATDHLNNAPTLGYTTSNVDANMTWQGPTLTYCNDVNNTQIQPAFLSGISDTNKTWDNVGEYKLHIVDTHWTEVDTLYLGHHTNAMFQSGSDCMANSDIVQNESSTSLNGCNISSLHTNTENSASFNDMNITYHPYTFDLSDITPRVRNNTTITANDFVYMSDISKDSDENMSYHLNGQIFAAGADNVHLNNFVDGCYAHPVTIFINKANISLPMAYRYRLHTYDQNGTELRDTNATDLNNTNGPISLVKADFPKDLNGSTSTILNLNYDRATNKIVNPIEFGFNNYEVNCTNPATDCTFKAELTDKTTTGLKDLNSSIKIRYYYGRANAGKQRYQVPDDAPYKANIYYEIYCFGAGCDANTLIKPVNPSLLHVDDIRWYQNTLHSPSKDGNVTNVFEEQGKTYVTSTPPHTANPTDVNLTYHPATFGYPYTTTMEVNASGWLIYNENDANATTNSFQVEFNKAGNGWVGKHETDAETNTTGAIKTNRRTMW